MINNDQVFEEIFSRIIPRIFRNQIRSNLGDLCFELKNGRKVAFQTLNSNMTIDDIRNITLKFNNSDFYVLWLLNGEGSYLYSPKYYENSKDTIITLQEEYIHRLYEGRTYYITLNGNSNNVPQPFALHFSLPDKKKNHKCFEKGFFHKKKYYIKNANISPIPNLTLLCKQVYVDTNMFLIARFYDKNVMIRLSSIIANFLIINPHLKNKRLLNMLIDENTLCGKYLILLAIKYLNKKQDVPIKENYLDKLWFSKRNKLRIYFPSLFKIGFMKKII